MRYFHGFSLRGEEKFLSDYLVEGDLCVAGFSYGAQQALEYTYRSQERIDRLVLLSPAFFQTEKPTFIRTQLRYFTAGKEAYVRQFLANVAYPGEEDLTPCLHTGSEEELRRLLSYRWEYEKIETILKRGTVIEVFLGEKDTIIDSASAYCFFKHHTITYWIKGAGHLLLRENR